MNEKYKNLYRIPSARLKNWDYASDGAYFITICTKNRTHFFGKCENGKMKLSTIGAIVQGLWFDIPNHDSSVILGDFVVMPNHIHGIIVIDKSIVSANQNNTDNSTIIDITTRTLQVEQETLQVEQERLQVEQERLQVEQERLQVEQETLQATSVLVKNEFYKKISPQAGSLARIVGGYKSSCTRHINAGFPDINFAWQERFWDNIIRTEESYDNISNYIINNPLVWYEDKFFN